MTVPPQISHGFVARPIDANKYSVGTVAVVGGSGHFPNAPVIAALGARSAGAGLIRLMVPDVSRLAAALLVPEATFAQFADDSAFPHADVTVIGMGLGTEELSARFVDRIFSGLVGRYVFDADALAVIAERYVRHGNFLPSAEQEFVFTPHEGEAARLLGWSRSEVAANRSRAAQVIAERYRATVVLKGAKTLVVFRDGSRCYENATGNPCMAMGGMGDLLSGVLGARWAYLKNDSFLAAASSVWLHSLASDRLLAEGGDPSLVNTAAKLGSLRAALDR